MWRGLGTFESLDLDGDGQLTREEIRVALQHKLGREPSLIMLDHVLGSLDFDGASNPCPPRNVFIVCACTDALAFGHTVGCEPPAWM